MPEHARKHTCPQCEQNTLLVQPLPDGTTQLVCVDLDCDFSEVGHRAEAGGGGSSPTDASFQARVQRSNADHLCDMIERLRQSVETLSGRGQSIARQQLALVRAELNRRRSGQQGQASCTSERPVRSGRGSSRRLRMPPQLNTPEVRARRIQGIRAYHRRQQAEELQTQAPPVEVAVATSSPVSDMWFTTLTRTLEQEADRHERAARDYAKAPELFALHVDHSARAFELKRVVDLLKTYSELGSGQPGPLFSE